ncbi:MAG: hypothetical protein Q8920_02975 [Bacillota bacterium]|nr:hypothetical protein [Bacillota bacterium]
MLSTTKKCGAGALLTDVELPVFITQGSGNQSRKTGSVGYGMDAVRNDRIEIRINTWKLWDGNFAPKARKGLQKGKLCRLKGFPF